MPAESITPTASAENHHRWMRLRHAWRLLLGRTLKGMPLHQWSSPEGLSAGWRRKTRTRWCEAILPIGNLYLRLLHAPSKVLSSDRWLEREARVANALNREIQIHPALRALDQKFLPGTSLRQILCSDTPIQNKLAAVRLAAAALRRLHSLVMCDSHGKDRCFTHGDATCDNVVVDIAAGTADWIDFDMQHRPGLPQADRRADDLRTLLFSAAGWVPAGAETDCVVSVVGGYGDDETVELVRKSVESKSCPTVFELAQAPLRFERFAIVRTSL